MTHLLHAVLSLGLMLLGDPATVVADGSSPQLTQDSRGAIRMIFSRGDTIFAVTSLDGGRRFSPAVTVGVVPGMHLGNTRGPTMASSRNRSVVLAADKPGNLTAFQLDHATGRWTRLSGRINDVEGSAPEGLATIAANDAAVFRAVWLDLREGRQNNIFSATVPTSGSKRSPNQRLYASPSGHVCECCRPTIVMSGRSVAVMFRNWLDGARDMYLTTSTNAGRDFSPASKLGNGTWMLTACPMDGGSVALDVRGGVATVWRRESSIYYSRPGEPEVKLATGRSPMMSQRDKATWVVWQEGTSIKIVSPGDASPATVLGEGRYPQVLALPGGGALVAWEKSGKIFVQPVPQASAALSVQ